jgi:hypothetical protein
VITSASTKAPYIVSTRAAWLTIGSGVAYQAALAALIFFRPDLDPSWHSVSEWATGPHGRIMSGTFVICSISYFSLFALLRTQLRSCMGQIGLAILLICAAGVAGAGLFTTDPMPFRPPLSVRGTLHVVCGTGQLVLFPFAALLINLSLARIQGGWAMTPKLLLWTAWLPLFAFVCFAVYTGLFVVPLGPQAYGPGVNIGWPPRFAFFTYTLWTLIVAGLPIRWSRMVPANATSPEREANRLPVTRALSQSR